MTILYERPVNAYDTDVIKYMTSYRKDGDSSWQLMPETNSLSETVTDLKQNIVYEFTVVAKYVRGQWGPESDRSKAKTRVSTTGKC